MLNLLKGAAVGAGLVIVGGLALIGFSIIIPVIPAFWHSWMCS